MIGEWLCKLGFHKDVYTNTGYATEVYWETIYHVKCSRCGEQGYTLTKK